MAGISDIVSRGFGSWGSVNDLPTRGFGIGAAEVLDARGHQYTATDNRAHYKADGNRAYYTASDHRLHYKGDK